MRTTSSLESLNATLRRMANPHPSFFKFIDIIRMHEFSKSSDLSEILKLNAPIRNRKSKKVEQLDIKIKMLTNDLRDNPDMSPGLFLEKLAKEVIVPNIGNLLKKSNGASHDSTRKRSHVYPISSSGNSCFAKKILIKQRKQIT